MNFSSETLMMFISLAILMALFSNQTRVSIDLKLMAYLLGWALLRINLRTYCLNPNMYILSCQVNQVNLQVSCCFCQVLLLDQVFNVNQTILFILSAYFPLHLLESIFNLLNYMQGLIHFMISWTFLLWINFSF